MVSPQVSLVEFNQSQPKSTKCYLSTTLIDNCIFDINQNYCKLVTAFFKVVVATTGCEGISWGVKVPSQGVTV